MKMINSLSSSLLGKIALGVGVTVAAPIIYRVVQSGQPLTARNVMKEGIRSYNQLRITLAEARENISDLAAEAQAESEAAAERTYEAPVEAAGAAAAEEKPVKATKRAAPKGKAK